MTGDQRPPEASGESTLEVVAERRPEAADGDQASAEPALTSADFAGHLEHTALFLPPALWEEYDELALELSHTLGRRVSNNTLILSLLAVRVPRDGGRRRSSCASG